MVVREVCPPWRSPRDTKHGHTRHGQHHHQWKACGRPCAAEAVDQGMVHAQRMRIAQLWCERVSLRGICRAVGVRLTWLVHRRVECLPTCPNHLYVPLSPPVPPRSWCPGWKPKPIRGGVGSRRRRTHKGSGSRWMRPPATSWRFMEGIGVVRVARSSGPLCRRSPVHRRRSMPVSWHIGRTVAVERDARARYPPSASNNALASWRSAVSKPSVNQP